MESFSARNFVPFLLLRCFPRRNLRPLCSTIQASQSMEDENEKIYKELGLFSLKKKIADAISRAEMIAPLALEFEEARRIKQEAVLQDCNLWDDIEKSTESLSALGDAIKMVNDLKDLQHKAEEVKLITQLAEMDVINHQLFKQAYEDSMRVSNFLDRYEMSKFLSGPYDKEGAWIIIEAGQEGIASEIWAEKLLVMYMIWAEKHGCKGRIIEKCAPRMGGIRSATVEFESEYFYGTFTGERGTHRMVRSSLDASVIREACSADVNVMPIFLEEADDLHVDEEDLNVSSLFLPQQQNDCKTEHAVSILHIPSGISAQSSGERSFVANKIKALARLKAKLLVAALEQGVKNVDKVRGVIANEWKHEMRRYMFRPHKMVQDLKTGIQLLDLNSVLDGNIEPLIRAHISLQRGEEIDYGLNCIKNK
ncbi:LOW QUALITY PROTEIN: peptide chain release factor PrfB3, chloroplastic [Dioscorea cayenensis subsp. rotundata]|uniref:LOW QUALITY PROTEIN: peptide chain release factor PrfB3, chloroplastic n=1 Tax=Dioscorea cayennensis subsp. rotundata TaxID=55577 RepID=A0AB40BPR2_DIOCR|nr:LOW QUALITY PROTEIN: peptide chain release factor PrfB3, chloroplastic [Dioscorea cayenensis subsp. rotundata]